jgi:hypothetical protein
MTTRSHCNNWSRTGAGLEQSVALRSGFLLQCSSCSSPYRDRALEWSKTDPPSKPRSKPKPEAAKERPRTARSPSGPRVPLREKSRGQIFIRREPIPHDSWYLKPAILRALLAPRERRSSSRECNMVATCIANTLKLLGVNGMGRIVYLLAKAPIWADIGCKSASATRL